MGGIMALLGKFIKGGLAAKAIQMAQRELKKPENQKRINDAMAKIKNRRRPARPRSVRISTVGGGAR
jgi:hypothetical protein